MINPELFHLLERRFGVGNVNIQAENREMSSTYTIDASQDLSDLRYKLAITSPGEEYYVRCPFCHDWKPRLYINHRWGKYDAHTRSKNLWLAHCWNEECLSSYDNQRSLYEQVVEYSNIGSVSKYATTVLRPQTTLKVRPPRKLEMPGAMWPLDDMVVRSPRHAAIAYVESRLWDAAYLGRIYGVQYCVESHLTQAVRRIVAPIHMQGEFKGWQARYVGDPPEGVAKWYTCPGMQVGATLYNFDRMCRHQTKVIVEGPADVWSFGPQACGIFNKKMTSEQIRLLTECVSSDDVIVILLDPAQDAKTKARGELHHIEKLYYDLNAIPKLARKVIKVYLPHGCDPDELDREYMHRLISAEAQRNKLQVKFTKPTGELSANCCD